jgi:hypothetical protein
MFDQQKNVFLMGFIADFMIAKLVNLVNKTATRVYGDYMGIINQLITAGGAPPCREIQTNRYSG